MSLVQRIHELQVICKCNKLIVQFSSDIKLFKSHWKTQKTFTFVIEKNQFLIKAVILNFYIQQKYPENNPSFHKNIKPNFNVLNIDIKIIIILSNKSAY